MKSQNSLVSIIIRTQNRPFLLKKALKSINAQTYRPLEVVVVNDGGAPLLIEDLQKNMRDVFFTYVALEKTHGRSGAANAGIEAAKGEFASFLDDDDIYYPDHVEKLVDACLKNGVEISYSAVQSVYYQWTGSAYADFIKIKDFHLYNFDFNRARLLFENYIPLNALLFSKRVLLENRFDENLEINEDWDLIIRLSQSYRFFHLADVTAEYRIFPKDESREAVDQIELDRKTIHSKWFRAVFDKHKGRISGKDWEDFYSGYLIPKHEDELQFLRDKIERQNTEIERQNTEIDRLNEALKASNEELALLRNSRSWKITSPLRRLKSCVCHLTKVIDYVKTNRAETVIKRTLVELYHSPLVGGWLRFFPAPLKQTIKSWIKMPAAIVPSPQMDLARPRVSLIIPVFNHVAYLDQCLRSATAQDYPELEIIVVDDASTDSNVRPLLKKYAADKRLRLYFNEKNRGISETQNLAIQYSSGDIIAFLDCDDYLAADAISSVLKYWKASTVYLHTARTNVDEKGDKIQRISFEHLPRKDYFTENLERMYATHFKLIRKDVFARVGMFDPRFDSAQDYDMLMRIAFYYPSDSFVFAPPFAYFHRIHGHQETSNSEERQLRSTLTIQNEACLRKNISEGKFDKNISFIMLSYGKHEQTVEAIQSIVDTVSVPFDIILFDNGSEAATVNYLKSKAAVRFPFVKMVFNSTNLGPAEGRRQALKYAKGPYYLVFDNDEIAQAGWIEELLVRAESDPAIAAVGTRVFFPDNTLQFSGGGINPIDDELIELVRFDEGKSRFDARTALFRDCDWLPIGATLFKVDPSSYLHAGYQNAFEDAGVSFGLRKKGYRLINAPAAQVLHNHFVYRKQISMKNKYLKDRYDRFGMLRAIASFYAENGLIIHDEYVWKENELGKLTRDELKKKLMKIHEAMNLPKPLSGQ